MINELLTIEVLSVTSIVVAVYSVEKFLHDTIEGRL